MRVLLIGAGVMSNYLEQSIKEKNYHLVGKVDYFNNGDFNSFDEVNEDFDILIDFSNPNMTKDLLEFALKKKKNILIGTTGHNIEQLDLIKKASEEIAILHSSNTSFGINALNLIIEQATKILKDFDIEIIEKHHNRKVDAPSGTAKTLLEIIDKSLNEDRVKVYGRKNKKREKNEIGVHSLRAGNIVGEHSVIYSNSDEIIEIKHEALSRKIFSDGAIKILNKLEKLNFGYFTMKDLI